MVFKPRLAWILVEQQPTQDCKDLDLPEGRFRRLRYRWSWWPASLVAWYRWREGRGFVARRGWDRRRSLRLRRQRREGCVLG